MTVHYVLYNLEENKYLRTTGMLTSEYRNAKTFDDKEEALVFLREYAEDIKKLGSDWTTREFFII